MMCTRAKHKGGKASGLGMSYLDHHRIAARTELMSCPNIGLAKSIRLELSEKDDEPDGKVGNASRVSLGDVGVPLRDFAVSSQAGLSGFDRGVPFDLLTGPVFQDDGSVVTLPGNSATDERVTAGA